MAQIVPSITVSDPVDFGHKLKNFKFAKRLHFDTGQPPFLPNRLINLAQISLPEGKECDLHLMLDHPEKQTEMVISLGPSLVIIHYEAKGDVKAFFAEMRKVGIKTGLALLPETAVEEAREIIAGVDHVLIFTGHLGYYGGELKKDCLPKIQQVKATSPEIEVCVDGGINPTNIAEVADAGADVVISGGFISNSENPKAAFHQLMEAMGD